MPPAGRARKPADLACKGHFRPPRPGTTEIEPDNFIRRRLLIGSPEPVALPFGDLRPFSVPSAFFDVQQTDAAMRWPLEPCCVTGDHLES
jgi:hypothetical protein